MPRSLRKGPFVDLHLIKKGEVLVTRSTSTAFNYVLPLVGAIVTDRGGLMSHAAIVAREYGLPGVVGCQVGTKTIPNGSMVRVNDAGGCWSLRIPLTGNDYINARPRSRHEIGNTTAARRRADRPVGNAGRHIEDANLQRVALRGILDEDRTDEQMTATAAAGTGGKSVGGLL